MRRQRIDIPLHFLAHTWDADWILGHRSWIGCHDPCLHVGAQRVVIPRELNFQSKKGHNGSDLTSSRLLCWCTYRVYGLEALNWLHIRLMQNQSVLLGTCHTWSCQRHKIWKSTTSLLRTRLPNPVLIHCHCSSGRCYHWWLDRKEIWICLGLDMVSMSRQMARTTMMHRRDWLGCWGPSNLLSVDHHPYLARQLSVF
jgi:hypothetical protein